MPRPKPEEPTPGELEVLKVLWEQGPSTVREVLEVLNRQRKRAYTSVMTLMNVMTDKGLVQRQQQGKAYVYEARAPKEKTLGRMLQNLLGKAFEGSASSLVANLFDECQPSDDELDEIRKTIDEYRQRQGDA